VDDMPCVRAIGFRGFCNFLICVKRFWDGGKWNGIYS